MTTTPLLDPTGYPLFKGFTLAGKLGEGYKVYAYQAGTSTPTTTYSDYLRTSANTWPVVLDSVGEAVIYLAVSTKLVYTDPDGNILWTFDNLFAPTGNFYSGAGVRSDSNVYAVDLTPSLTALDSTIVLVMVPDKDNLDTMENPTKAAAQVFTGSGVNDLTWVGPYTGTTAGSVFTVQIDGVAPTAPGALTAALVAPAAPGNLSAGIYSYVVTYVTALGETQAGTQSTGVEVTAPGVNGQMNLTSIPVSASADVTDRNIYRTEANGSVYYFLHAMGDNSTTTYTDNIADASLTDQVPAVTLADTFKWKKDGGAWTEKVIITAANQSLIEGIFVKFADVYGHTLNDIWTLTVMTPASVNVDGLGNVLVYKNVSGTLLGLDKGDIKANIPATLVYSVSNACWILNNPSTAAAEGPLTIRTRKEITAAYNMTTADAGNVVSCTGTFTVKLPTVSDGANQFYYVLNKSNGTITIDPQGAKIYGYGNHTGASYFYLVGKVEAIQLQSNGRDWEIMTMVVGAGTAGADEFSSAGTFYWTAPAGVTSIDVEGAGGGGGGADVLGAAGSSGAASTISTGVPYAAAGGAGGSGTCAYPGSCYTPQGWNGGYGYNGNGAGQPSGYGGFGAAVTTNTGIAVTAGTTYTVVVGAGGAGAGTPPTQGQPGGSGYIKITYSV